MYRKCFQKNFAHYVCFDIFGGLKTSGIWRGTAYINLNMTILKLKQKPFHFLNELEHLWMFGAKDNI
ncbi:hypothetical protein NPIL_703611 [Nephila pilipes]|uniref:Uncharacterized protein n=1 Tax=Nephila pilipes TaxID=299642 RepID=A0A8X6MVA7_NEPPI|nr:hypothetical protein NPIL_703611 [Nephila pilipes]